MADEPGPTRRKRPFQWRRWNNVLHRDIGYSIFVLTFVYAISGVAVNHSHQWNPNYVVTHRMVQLGPVQAEALQDRQVVEGLLAGAGLPSDHRTTFRTDPQTVRIFLEEGTVDVDLATGEARVELVRNRRLLYELNFLHLNTPKQLWTWVADLYAILLAFVALTGLFVRKGDKGLFGRGKWFVALGLAVPVVALIVYL